MIDFNPSWIYALGQELSKLDDVRADVPMGDQFRPLMGARGLIDEFLNHQQHTLLPHTCEELREVLQAIDTVCPLDARLKHSAHVLTRHEVANIHLAVRRAVDTLERECLQRYIVGLEKQRALEPKTLIEEIESAFAPECWRRFSAISKRELEECGKCLAFERYTASGFHALRAFEYEVRDYAIVLTHEIPRKRDLGFYVEQLKTNGADAKLISTLDNIRSLERNPLMHPEDWLDADSAMSIFNTVQVALERLISDMQKKGLLPPLGV